MRKLILGIGVFCLGCTILRAQTSSIDYRYARMPSGQEFLQEIHFVSGSDGSILKKVGVNDANPYGKLDYPQLLGEIRQFQALNLKGSKLRDLIPEDYIAAYSAARKNPEQAVDKATSDLFLFNENPGFALLGFTLSVWSGQALCGILSSLKVYDIRGNEVINIPKYDVNPHSLALSEKGRFMAHLYGASDSTAVLIPDGLRIFDLAYRKYVDIRIKSPKLAKLTERYLLVFGESPDSPQPEGSKLLFFDFWKGLVYTQVYDAEVASKLRVDFDEAPRFFIDGKERIPEKDFGMQQLEWLPLREWK